MSDETNRCLEELTRMNSPVELYVDDTVKATPNLTAERDGMMTSAAAEFVEPYVRQLHERNGFLPDDIGAAILGMKDKDLVPVYGAERAESLCAYVTQQMTHNQDARTALVLMTDETDRDAQKALLVKKALESMHGLYHVELVHNAQEAIEYMKDNHAREHIDVMVLGEGFEYLAHQVESSRNKEIVTIAVSTNGVRADRKVPDTDRLMDLVWTRGAVQRLYRSNEDAQMYRRKPVDNTLEIRKPEAEVTVRYGQ